MKNLMLMGHPLMAQCTKFVTRHKPLTQRQWLQRMLDMPETDLPIDTYGDGPAVDLLEQKMAKVLGKERALFVHKGMVAQFSALLHWSKANNSKYIAIHPQSHIQVDESMAYSELLGLEGVMFGEPDQPITSADIDRLPADLATVCIELPVRRAGFKLPEWHTLVTLREYCDSHDVPLHIDGGRLWESADYWQKSYAEVAGLADSVYVSLYKGLGAAAGGIIAGDSDFIEQLLPWRSRFGGNIFTVFPYVLTALWGVDNYLPRISEFNQRAGELATVFKAVLGEQAIPNPVQCNGFMVELTIAPDLLKSKVLEAAEQQHIWLIDRISETSQGNSQFEIQVGDAMDDWTNQALVETFAGLL